MNWFELSPYFRLTIFTIILVVAVFSPAQLKKASDDITKQNAVRHLDGYSLSVLSNMTGLMFGGGNFGPSEMDALRHLMSLELIELDAFPSMPVSWGYYLTNLGRYVLTTKLERKLYPKDFCEMIRVRYWKGSPARFVEEKKAFKNHKISWDDSWQAFDRVIRIIEPNQSKKDAIEIFEAYLSGKSYDTVMKEVVIPWQNEIMKLRNK